MFSTLYNYHIKKVIKLTETEKKQAVKKVTVKLAKTTVKAAIKLAEKHQNMLFNSDTLQSTVSDMKVMFFKKNLKKKVILRVLKLNSELKRVILKLFNKNESIMQCSINYDITEAKIHKQSD